MVSRDAFSSLAKTFYNVLSATLGEATTQSVLTTEEALLTWLVCESKKDYFHDLCCLVTQVPIWIDVTEDAMIDNVLEIVYETHYKGADSFGKLLAVLSFVSCYIEFLLNTMKPSVRWKFAKRLASFYLNQRGDWLMSIGGLNRGIKERFPHYWQYFHLKQKWLRFTYSLWNLNLRERWMRFLRSY
nr:homolog of EHV2 E4 apoptosis regulator BALF1 [Macronycteris gammaherpesvirus 1]